MTRAGKRRGERHGQCGETGMSWVTQALWAFMRRMDFILVQNATGKASEAFKQGEAVKVDGHLKRSLGLLWGESMAARPERTPETSVEVMVLMEGAMVLAWTKVSLGHGGNRYFLDIFRRQNLLMG